MSTQTNTDNTPAPAFKSGRVEDKPTKYCVGTVSEVAPGKVTKSETYIWQQISIAADENGQDAKVGFMYRPEWFVSGFDPETLLASTEKENSGDTKTIGEKLYDQYCRHIYGDGRVSTLQGLAGSDAAFAKLSARLVSDKPRETSEVDEILRKFLVEEQGNLTFGYTLKQGSEKVIGDDGEVSYKKTAFYEVDNFWYDTPENRKAKVKAARKAAEKGRKVLVTFEVE